MMITNEFTPIIGGMLLGSLVGCLRSKLRLRIGALLAVVLSVAATVGSGEFRLSLAYLVVDFILVAASATIAFVVVRRLRWAN